jgi:hypothetical protein
MGANALFSVVIGPWQSRDLIAGEEPWPVTARDVQEVGQGRGESPSGSPVPPQRAQHAAQTTLEGHPGVLVLVGEARGRPMDPARGHTPLGPQRGGLGQAAWEDGWQPDEGLGPRPLFVPRSRRWASAVSRSCSVSPEAARGGWPSSVRAQRTARQEPRLTSASGSVRWSN